jgi:hypothetical protein
MKTGLRKWLRHAHTQHMLAQAITGFDEENERCGACNLKKKGQSLTACMQRRLRGWSCVERLGSKREVGGLCLYAMCAID